MFLLTVLGLWIPAVYTLIFVVACAVMGVAFADALGLYYIGLCLSCIAALGLAVRQVLKAKTDKKNGKRASTENISKIELKEQPKKVAPKNGAPAPQQANPQQYAQQPYQPQPYPQQQYAQPQPQQYAQQPYANPQPYQPQPYGQGYDNGYNQQYAQPQPQGYNAGGQTAYERAMAEQSGNAFQGYYNAGNTYDGSSFSGGYPAQPAGSMNYNTPIVYRTKADPNVIIHEFSDRLVFYRRTLNGLEHEYTEPKRNNGNNGQ